MWGKVRVVITNYGEIESKNLCRLGIRLLRHSCSAIRGLAAA